MYFFFFLSFSSSSSWEDSSHHKLRFKSVKSIFWAFEAIYTACDNEKKNEINKLKKMYYVAMSIQKASQIKIFSNYKISYRMNFQFNNKYSILIKRRNSKNPFAETIQRRHLSKPLRGKQRRVFAVDVEFNPIRRRRNIHWINPLVVVILSVSFSLSPLGFGIPGG